MKPEKDKALKAVILIGNNLIDHSIDDVIKLRTESQGQVEILGNGIDEIQTLNLESLRGRTNPETLFCIFVHGINIDGDKSSVKHYIDGIPTADFLQKLQKTAGHPIYVDLCSCHSGGALKRSEVGDEISLLAESGSKTVSMSLQNSRSIIKNVKKKLSGASILEVFADVVKDRPSSIYYLPHSQEKKIDEKDDKAVKDKKYFESLRKQRGIIKFSRPGKFTLEEVVEILSKVFPSNEDWQREIITKLTAAAKNDFSLGAIKKILAISEKLEDEGKDHEKIDYNPLISALRKELSKKLLPANIKSYLASRGMVDKVFGIVEEKKSDQSDVEDKDDPMDDSLESRFFNFAYNVELQEEVVVMIRNNRDLAKNNMAKLLRSQFERRQTAILEVLIDLEKELRSQGESILSNPQLQSIINYVIFQNHHQLLEKMMNFNEDIRDIINARSNDFPLEFAIKSQNLEIVKKIINTGADINQSVLKNEVPISFFRIAAFAGNAEILQEIINAGAFDLFSANQQGEDIISELARAGANPEIREIISKARLQRQKLFAAAEKIYNPSPGIPEVVNLDELINVIKESGLKETSFYNFVASGENCYYPLISGLMPFLRTPESIKLLSDNLDLFISKNNLLQKDQYEQIPADVAIYCAQRNALFIPLAAQLIIETQKINPAYKYEVQRGGSFGISHSGYDSEEEEQRSTLSKKLDAEIIRLKTEMKSGIEEKKMPGKKKEVHPSSHPEKEPSPEASQAAASAVKIKDKDVERE